MTAQLMAAEILQKVKSQLTPTPNYWVTSVEVKEHLQRFVLTLRYLQTCYLEAPAVLPVKLRTDEGAAPLLRELAQRLHSLATESLEEVGKTIATVDDQLISVPKYYYSELRNKRSCTLPVPPKALTSTAVLSFFVVEAIAGLRSEERFTLLINKEGDPAGNVSPEMLASLSKRAASSAVAVVATLVRVFGEEKVKKELEECLKDEQAIYANILAGLKSRLRVAGPTTLVLDEEDDQDTGEYCSILGYKPIFIVSDCTGESAERTIQSALGQFGHCFDRSCPVDITLFRFTTTAMVKEIVEQAADQGAFIVFTLVDPWCNSTMVSCCDELGVEHHDLWSPLLEKLESFYGTFRLGVPGRRQITDERYMKLIECIEYTRTLDDGVNPKRWAEADLMIIGPSRSGKTPLAFFMAQRGYKVANYPLVPDEEIPKELYELDQDRVFALSIQPLKLAGIRNTRMETLKMGSNSSYAKMSRIQEELDWCTKLYRKHPRWHIIDTTDSGIEENCAKILMVLDRLGKGRSRTGEKVDNPSAI